MSLNYSSCTAKARKPAKSAAYNLHGSPFTPLFSNVVYRDCCKGNLMFLGISVDGIGASNSQNPSWA